MVHCPFDFFSDGKKHTICLVGGGGKTTVMYELAAAWAACGRRVLVLTSTHILRPVDGSFAADATAVQNLWQQGRYAVIGTPEPATGKLTAPPQDLYEALQLQADVILCEADGSRHHPCKVPAAHEPVLLPDSDIVLAVAGMDALGNSLQQACQRPQLAAELLSCSAEKIIDAQMLASLLLSEQGARKNVGARAYYIVLNKCDLIKAAQQEEMLRLLVGAGMDEHRIWLRERGE
ncbi:putative selenium-dependent hydroxylase accessory protein YqeC [Phascolarctobacterium succinatutens CAG:287]|uniref:Putative selenium-dependent hydroxylase accessory protein YqeC n=1 Tax=Phascolarctobacterium succinatutens CAG:287 TaxID=1263101 RepID=R6X0M3_9FIRM|nr:selenium cofactor biosynthesis protein YqeC [Phascolarctobacterium succinatutens]CDD09856.1 putative selenium-dependent hydroxylase accessory protein YqeC [Phascolarctobacterium succinatutens CAG:287]